MNVTTTLNPLHFEDLEPHRFEDMVRQLIYDFKEWHSLEATGRAGSDQGFDIRGYERMAIIEEVIEEDEELMSNANEQRLWLIQCKRQKRIGPEDIKRYIDEIETKENIYGIIFAAACDFSKKARDAFFARIRVKGILEGHLWGKAELEDMLFQPKNDYLLFAYFGISLSIQKRSVKTALNSKLSIKRKLVKIFGDINNPNRRMVLLRDVNDRAYPYREKANDFNNNPPWILRTFVDYYYDGIVILTREYYAYLKNETQEWDYYEDYFSRGGFVRQDPWSNRDERKENPGQLIHDYWYYRIPPNNQAWFRVYCRIPFENIIAIDEIGDEWTQDFSKCPHLYLVFHSKTGPFSDMIYGEIEQSGQFTRHSYNANKEKRIKIFPDIIPEIPKKEKEAKLSKKEMP